MTRSSKSITLALIGTASVALIGSAFLVKGCDSEEEQARDAEGRPVAHRRAGGFFFIPRFGMGGFGFGGGGGGGGGGVATAPSARGGFGGIGSAGVGS